MAADSTTDPAEPEPTTASAEAVTTAPDPDSSAANGTSLWMRVGLYLSGGLLVLVVLLLVVGMLLPGRYRVERSTVIEASPEAIHAVVADLRTWKDWTVWTRETYSSLQYEYEGAESGVGAIETWEADEGNGRLEITESDPATGIAYEMLWGSASPDKLEGDNGTFPPLDGTIRYTPVDGGTRVTWVAEGSLGANPIARWFGLMFDSLIGPDYEKGLEGLKEAVEG